MSVRRKWAWLTVTAAMLLFLLGADAEPVMKETMKGNKVVRREWVDENGALTE